MLNYEGASIVQVRVMKLSGLVRLTIELTEQDSRKLAAPLIEAQIKGLLHNGQITFTQIEGENNGFEEQIENDYRM